MTAQPATAAAWNTIDDLLPLLGEISERSDGDDSFVGESVQALAARHFLEALVPCELGGGGARHAQVCETLRQIAHACPSTALCLSMHQHLVSAAVWRWQRDRSADGLLKRVASEHLLLVSTGANDWLESNGTMAPVEGGYRLNATKSFASGSAGGDVVVTSARLESEVLHFSVPLSAPGVSIRPDWMAMGMRGTGSNSIEFKDVFVPEAAVTLRRAAGRFHPVWSVVLTVACPLIMSAYLGVAERATEIALSLARPDEPTFTSLGLMFDALTTARLARDRMIAICNDFDFAPAVDTTNEVVACKAIAAREVVHCVEHAIAAAGGRAYFRKHGLERLARDVRAAAFHPVQELRQARMTGRILLGLDPGG